MFDNNQPRHSILNSGTLVSFLLHLFVASCMLCLARSPQVQRSVMRQLNIEIVGPSARHQVVAQQKRIESQRAAPPAARKQEEQIARPHDTPQPAPAEIKANPSERRSDSPVALNALQAAAAPLETGRAGGAPAQNGNSEYQQRQMSVGGRSSDQDLINAYSSMLAKLVNSHLIYPNDVRKKRLEGVTWVSFVVTSSGALKPDTLVIKRSSGYAVLDANALKTIQSLAPFQPPPRELTVSLAIDFAVDR